ncbi:MAG: type II secretion system F family protein [Treponema sp.]|nr:type II secretion system F family protein [Treponema sp.]
MTNLKKIKVFTDSVFELYVAEKVPLEKCLEILVKSKFSFLRKSAVFLLKEMKCGAYFSNALFKCPYVNFDSVYLSFISFAEKTGDLESSIIYLQQRCKRKEENLQKIIGSSVYPAFIFMLTIFIFAFLIFFCKKNFAGSLFEYSQVKAKLIRAALFFFLIFLIILGFLKKKLGENKILEAFKTVDFLVKAGNPLSQAFIYGRLIVGSDSKIGHLFEKAEKKLEEGINLTSAFDFKQVKALGDAFYFAEKTGNQINVFEKICKWMEVKNEKNRKIYLSLVEPLFITATGLFLMTLVLTLLFPVISDINLTI